MLEDATLYKIDCEKGEGVELAERYEVRGYPTFKMVDARGEEIEAWIGYDGPEKWVDVVEAGLADRRTLAEKAEAYAREPTLALAKSLANAAATEYEFREAVTYLKKARELDPNPMAAAMYTEGIMTNMYYGVQMEQFTFDEVDAEAMPILDMPMAPVEARVQVAAMMVDLARTTDDMDAAVPYLEKAMGIGGDSDDAQVQEMRAALAVDHALLIEKDAAKAVDLKRNAMGDGWMDDAARLNRFAWWCFENDVNLAEAESLALRGVELAGSDAERANILDTAAEIAAARGNTEEAVARIEQAIALDPEKAYFKDQLARFQEQLKNKQG